MLKFEICHYSSNCIFIFSFFQHQNLQLFLTLRSPLLLVSYRAEVSFQHQLTNLRLQTYKHFSPETNSLKFSPAVHMQDCDLSGFLSFTESHFSFFLHIKIIIVLKKQKITHSQPTIIQHSHCHLSMSKAEKKLSPNLKYRILSYKSNSGFLLRNLK